MFVTGRFALALAIGVVPVVLASVSGVPAWWAAGGWVLLCVLLAVLDAVVAASGKLVRVTRDRPGRTLLDQPVTVRTLLHNTGTKRVRGLLRDAWQPTAGAPAERAKIDLPAGERRAVDLVLRPRRRGELRSQFVVIRSVGPLGLAGRQSRVDAPASVRVLPPFHARRHLPSRLARLRELDGNTSVNVRGQGTEFDSLREYVRGDDVRSIDWRATARAGTTMLRTWRPERDRHVVIVVDTGRTSATRVGDGVRMDASLEAALLLSALAARAGDHVHLVMFDRARRARVTRSDGPRLLPTMIDAMAPVEPQLIDTDWDAVISEVAAMTNRPSLVVLLTAQDSPAAARGFLGALPSFTQKSHVLVASAADMRPEDPPRRTADDVYLEASYERSQRDAHRVAGAIARAGAEAIVASTDELPPLVADRYLALKAAGRL